MLTASLSPVTPPADQGARHAEEGVPRAGGDVRGRDGCMQVICCGESGNAQSRPAGDAEKRLVSGKEGEAASLTGQIPRTLRSTSDLLSDPVTLVVPLSRDSSV